MDQRKYTTGRTFRRMDTVLAAVLVWLLEVYRPLTAWDGVEVFRTRHIEAAIRTLRKKYGWPIETIWLPTRRPDGTLFYARAYKLPQAAIFHAYDNLGAFNWIKLVKVAQARKRARDDAKAAALDTYLLKTGHPSVPTIQQYLYRR